MKKPNPGSDEALERGCRCPVLDNGHGRGCGRTDTNGNPLFWYSDNCPLHRADYDMLIELSERQANAQS